MALPENVQLEIDRKKALAAASYPEIWQRIITEWKSPGAENRAWLMYSANYLLRTNGIRWAIDPYLLSTRISETAPVNVGRDLAGLSFVLLTHLHADHFDPNVIRALSGQPIQWIVPTPLIARVREAGVPPARMIVPEELVAIELDGIKITPFRGLHEHTTSDGKTHGVPSMGYRIEYDNHGWLFPGDTRHYDAGLLPHFENNSIVFAHLWLGRAAACSINPPLLEEFCQFFAGLSDCQIVVTHLKEFGRDADDFWDHRHFEQVRARLAEIAPETRVSRLQMGESLLLE